ncbi:MAG: VanZ family protein [Candidatus Zixiibacteriota bacterium]
MSAQLSQPRPSHTFFVFHLPAILYAAAILVVSSLPPFHAPSLGVSWSDKLLHFAEYAFFAVLTFRSFTHISQRMSLNRAFLLSALFLSVFAILDELHQHYIPGRDPDLADLAGDLLGGLVVLAFLRRRAQRSNRKTPQA